MTNVKSSKIAAHVKGATTQSDSSPAVALKRMQNNPRIRAIAIIAPAEACPACQQLVGTYAKDHVPPLPTEACSHPLGCRATYLPVIDELYP